MAGVEPARCCHQRILSPSRLPIPTHRLNELAALSARLDAMSPLKVLSRGYAIVSDENGKVIKRTEDAKPGDVLTARVEDGAITVQVQKTEKREMTDA